MHDSRKLSRVYPETEDTADWWYVFGVDFSVLPKEEREELATKYALALIEDELQRSLTEIFEEIASVFLTDHPKATYKLASAQVVHHLGRSQFYEALPIEQLTDIESYVWDIPRDRARSTFVSHRVNKIINQHVKALAKKDD